MKKGGQDTHTQERESNEQPRSKKESGAPAIDYAAPENLQKITKIQALNRGFLARKSISMIKGSQIIMNEQQFPDLVTKHDFTNPTSEKKRHEDKYDNSSDEKLDEQSEGEEDREKQKEMKVKIPHLQEKPLNYEYNASQRIEGSPAKIIQKSYSMKKITMPATSEIRTNI